MEKHTLAYHMGWVAFWTLSFIYACINKDVLWATIGGGLAVYHAFSALDRYSRKE